MSDERLRDLERRWKESGSLEDEAAYTAELYRAEQTPISMERTYLVMRRLFDAGFKDTDLAAMLAYPNGQHAQAMLEALRESVQAASQARQQPPQEEDRRYPPEYQPFTVIEQRQVWVPLRPGLDTSHIERLVSRPLPQGAEFHGVIPKAGDDYCAATQRMISTLAGQQALHNYREGALGSEHLRETQAAREWRIRLEQETPGDFLVVPVQFGLRYRGRSVEDARVLFTANEVGLGPYEVAALLVSHPNRITGSGQLYIDCAGCEYRPEASGPFGFCRYFDWDDGRLSLGDYGAGNGGGDDGSASALASQ